MSIDAMAAVRERREAREVEEAEARNNPVSEPLSILAVVEDRQGRRYFRWSHDSHTLCPWRLLGAVHVDTEEDFSWAGLMGSRLPVRVVGWGVES